MTFVAPKVLVTLPPPGQAGGVERLKLVAPVHSSFGGCASAIDKQLKRIAKVKNALIYMDLDRVALNK